MGGSPKRGGSNGGTILSRGRVFLIVVLLLQLVLVVCLMRARSDDSVELDSALEDNSVGSRGSWLWRKFVISTTPPNCTDANGKVVTEATKGSEIKCSDRSSLLRLKWLDPKQDAPKSQPAENTPINRATNRATNPSTDRATDITIARTKARATDRATGRTAARATDRATDRTIARATDRATDRTIARATDRATESIARNVTTRLRTGITSRREKVGYGGARGRGTGPVERTIVRNGSGDRRVQVGRDLPAIASSEEARETKSSSSRLEREYADEVRSSLQRDSLRFRGRSGRYGDRRASNATVAARIGRNVSDSVAPVAVIEGNVSDSIAPGSRTRANLSDSIVATRTGATVSSLIEPVASIQANVSDSIASLARIGENVTIGANVRDSIVAARIEANRSDSIAPVARTRSPVLAFDEEGSEENLRKEESEEEFQKEEEEEDPDVTIARSEVSFSGRRGPLPSFNVSRKSNTSLEISTTSNSSLEIGLKNASLEIPTTRNASLEITATRNTALEITPKNSSLVITTRNTTLEITARNSSLEAIPTTRNASLEQTLPPLTRNSTSSKNLQQVASPVSAISAANATSDQNATIASSNATCAQGLIYVYTLPKKFNTALLENCSQLLHWGDRCRELSNGGLGPFLSELGPRRHSQKQGNGTEPETATEGPWYGTDQFSGEVIFHKRILAHPCRTHNPELAKAFYVPYYGGLDVARFLFNVTEKQFTAEETDHLGSELSQWLSRSPYWKRHHGVDHFLFLGRITWDFRRKGSHGWGSSLINMPEMANVTKLVLERSPWDANETAIPYPTAFHPKNDSEVVAWQKVVLETRRDLLFSVAGGKRAEFPNDFRVALFDQCKNSSSCEVLDCANRKCEDDPLAASKLFMRSTFCLQPRGDSFTRRSIFDALVAGCIPVFFWTKSAYLQYTYHFPSDHKSYSVFIPKQDVRNGVLIEDVLRTISPAKVQQMQRAVAEMIPKLVYAANPTGLGAFRDAFDVAIDSVMTNFESHRNTTTLNPNPNPNSSPGSSPISSPSPDHGVIQVVGGPGPVVSSKPEVASRV